MRIKESLANLRWNLSSGMGSGLRFFLASVLVGLSLGLMGLSSYLITTPVLTDDDVLKEAVHWTQQNCSNRLEDHSIDYLPTEEGIKVLLTSSSTPISRDDLVEADMALLTCPGMRMRELCVGSTCGEQFMMLAPIYGR